MTNLQALQNLEIAAAAFLGTRDQHTALIEAITTLKQLIDAAEKKPEPPLPEPALVPPVAVEPPPALSEV